jgi:hypothetical protein
MLKTKLTIHKEKIAMNERLHEVEKLYNKYADVNKELGIKLMSDEEVKQAALNEKPINDNPIIDNPKEEIIIKENNNNNIIIDNDNLIKNDNNIISTNTNEDIINTNSQPAKIDLNNAKIEKISDKFIDINYKGKKYTIDLRFTSREKQVVELNRAISKRINDLRVKLYGETNLVEVRKINTELKGLLQQFSDNWDAFDNLKLSSEFAHGQKFTDLEFIKRDNWGTDISSGMGDLNNYVKVLDEKGNTVIVCDQSNTFKLTDESTGRKIPVKVTSEYGLQPQHQRNIQYFGAQNFVGSLEENYDLNVKDIKSIELSVHANENYMRGFNKDTCFYPIDVKITLNDNRVILDHYDFFNIFLN